MSVQEKIPYVSYIANGSTAKFNIPFDLHNAGYLVVTVDKMIPAVGGYIVNLNDMSITFVTAPRSGAQVELYRDTKLKRDTNYQSYDNSFRPSSVNFDFDSIWQALQDQHMVDARIAARIREEIEQRRVADGLMQGQIEILNQVILSVFNDASSEYVANKLTELNSVIQAAAAAAAGANGWTAQLVVDGSTTQRQINDGLESIAQMLEIPSPRNNQRIYVKETDSFYVYDSSNTTPVSLDGWVLQHNGTVSTDQLNITDGADITALLSYAVANKLFIELPADHKFTTTTFTEDTQSVLVGEGSVQYIFNYLANDNTEHVAPKTASPYPQKAAKNYGWYDSVQARGNFEHGVGRGLIVNDYGARPQICGFRTKQQQKNYPSVDIAGQYTHVMAPKVQTLTNCTFTANSVTSASITSALDIKVGDFINTEYDPAIGKPWRSEVTAIDLVNNKLSVTWWLHESGSGEGIPPNGLSCYTPYVNGLWGENTNVFIRADDKVTTIVGYELGVATEKPRANFTQINGYYVVNLTSNVARAQTAYKVGGKWDQALLVDDCTAAVVTTGLSKCAVDYTANTDLDSAAVIMRNPYANGGNLTRSVAGFDVLYNVDFAGVQSALKLTYSIHSADIVYNGLQPSVCIGANSGGVAHTTTISTARMFGGHILEFKQLEAVNWTIIAGGNTFVLNTSGAADYLKIMYDGNFFVKLFMGKSS